MKLPRIFAGTQGLALAKLEMFNPGGSVKDRIAQKMIEDAETRGDLKPGGTIVEPTSGNTGMGLAMVGAIRGYRTVFTIPDKMSREKLDMLKAFGARVIVTPTAVAPENPESYYKVAERVHQETPNSILPNQYANRGNPVAHYETTGPEIWRDTDGRVTHFVCGMGTGGTISGVGKYLKEQNAKVRIIGVDPLGSILKDYFFKKERSKGHPYKIEGIGEDFIPGTTWFEYIDDVIKVSDKEAYLMTRRLAREEGVLAGSSSGAALVGARRVAETLSPDDVLVVLLPDSGLRYLSKAHNEEWLKEQGGVAAVAARNIAKAGKLYAAIDASPFYSNPVEPACRSRMNVPFRLAKPELEKTFAEEAKAQGLVSLEGHRSVGGMRASIYNAMPEAGVDSLIAFMAEFERKNG